MENPHKHTERELLQRIAQGDETAFRQFFYQWKGKLFSFLLHLTDDRALAEDIVQEVFIKIWQKRGLLTQVENAEAYIYRMVHNHAIDQLRRLARRQIIVDMPMAGVDIAILPDDEMRAREIRLIFQKALQNLSPQQRKIFILHREGGLKHEEIARLMDLSVSTVQNHMFRAVESIRNTFRLADPGREVFLLLAFYFSFS